MKEEISQQRCTIGAHWYTNNMPEDRASNCKTNVDVVDKKVNNEKKLCTREVHVLFYVADAFALFLLSIVNGIIQLKLKEIDLYIYQYCIVCGVI